MITSKKIGDNKNISIAHNYVYDISLDGTIINAYAYNCNNGNIGMVMSNTDG